MSNACILLFLFWDRLVIMSKLGKEILKGLNLLNVVTQSVSLLYNYLIEKSACLETSHKIATLDFQELVWVLLHKLHLVSVELLEIIQILGTLSENNWCVESTGYLRNNSYLALLLIMTDIRFVSFFLSQNIMYWYLCEWYSWISTDHFYIYRLNVLQQNESWFVLWKMVHNSSFYESP